MKRTKLFKKFCALALTAVTLMTFCSSGGTAVLAEEYEEGFYYSDEQDFEDEAATDETQYYSSGEEPSQETKQEGDTKEKEDVQQQSGIQSDESISVENHEDLSDELDSLSEVVGTGVLVDSGSHERVDITDLLKKSFENIDTSGIATEGSSDSTPDVNVKSASTQLTMSLLSSLKAASSTSGASVQLNVGREIAYSWGGNYSTHLYQAVTSDGIGHTAFCGQAELGKPNPGTYTIRKLTTAEKAEANVLKFILLTSEWGDWKSIPTPWNLAGLGLHSGFLSPEYADEYNYDYMYGLQHQFFSFGMTGYLPPSFEPYRANFETVWSWACNNAPNYDTSAYELYYMSTGSTTQNIYWIDGAERGKISVQKVSGNDTLTSGNSNYSLQNAVYGVYDTFGNHITSITTNDTGYSESDWLNPGDYFVQEIQAPKGYQIDNTRYSVRVTPGNVVRVQMNGGDNHIEPPKTGRINLYKTSANPDCTNGNPNYSYKGAEYTVYRDIRIRKGTNGQSVPFNPVGTITTDNTGFGTLGNLAFGTYYVKETKSSPGFDLDETIYTVTITDVFGVNEVQVAVNSKEPPKMDPVSFMLKKVDSITGNKPVGSGSMEDAHYELRFYGDIMTTDPALSGKTPLRTWVLKTIALPDGAALIINDLSKISGDAFWYDCDGNISFPYGTLTIHEIKSPNGYLLNNETIVVPVTGDDISIDPQYHEPIQKEVALSLNLYKYQSGTNYPVKGATFVHTKPDGSTETLTTDENGYLSFHGLQWGNHKVVETAIIDGLEVNRNPITFNVSEKNKITITSSATETDTDGNIILKVEDDGNISATVYDKPSPFDLHISKINNHDLKLKGAEFTLYSDAECKNPIARKVSDANGDITFEDLIPQRNYYLKETKAPAGYRIPINDDGSDIVWQINVTSFPTIGAFTFYVNNVPYTTQSSGSYTVSGTVKDRVVNMTIVNQIGSKLPVTGSNATLIILGAGLALIGVSVFLRKKKWLL